MRIRSVLRVMGVIVMVPSSLGIFVCLLDLQHTAVVLAECVGIFLLAGVLWVLTEISEQLAELPDDLRERESKPSAESVSAPLTLPQRRA